MIPQADYRRAFLHGGVLRSFQIARSRSQTPSYAELELEFDAERWAFRKREVVAPVPGAGVVVLDQFRRRVSLDGKVRIRESVSETQMEYLLICALARRRDEWVTAIEIERWTRMSNARQVLRSLSQNLKPLVNTKGRGHQLAMDAVVDNDGPLRFGARIDWAKNQFHLESPNAAQDHNS